MTPPSPPSPPSFTRSPPRPPREEGWSTRPLSTGLLHPPRGTHYGGNEGKNTTIVRPLANQKTSPRPKSARNLSPLLLLLLLLHSAPPISLLREHPSPFPLSCAAFLSSSTILRLFISKSSNFSFSNRRSSRFSFFWEREREKINGFISKIGDQIFHLLSR